MIWVEMEVRVITNKVKSSIDTCMLMSLKIHCFLKKKKLSVRTNLVCLQNSSASCWRIDKLVSES